MADLKDVRTVQQTGKGIKLTIMIGVLLMIWGIARAVYGLNLEQDAFGQRVFGGGVATFFFGGVIWIVGRILKWWKHS